MRYFSASVIAKTFIDSMIKYIDELKKEELENKKVLLRADLDIPVVDGKIGETFRIKAQKETIDYLVNNGAKVLMVAHLGHEVSDASFGPVAEEIGEILGQILTLVPHSELAGIGKLFEAANVLLLDNLRQDKREVENNEGFARELFTLSSSNGSKGFDYYVNNCFATMHREHASLVAITKFLPSYAGLLIKKEIENLKQAMDAPAEGKVLILGGAKISTKMPVIKNFVGIAEKLLIGGALANDFFQAQGIKIGASVVDDTVAPDVRSENIILPRDFITGTRSGDPESINPHTKRAQAASPLDSDSARSGVGVKIYKKVTGVGDKEAILDIGPETAEEWAEIIERAKMVIWNGPMGYFESKNFEEGTEVIAQAVTKAERSIIGGGDTITAVNKFGLLDKYTFVSTGGGAMLEFLAGNRLPGLEALGYY